MASRIDAAENTVGVVSIAFDVKKMSEISPSAQEPLSDDVGVDFFRDRFDEPL